MTGKNRTIAARTTLLGGAVERAVHIYQTRKRNDSTGAVERKKDPLAAACANFGASNSAAMIKLQSIDSFIVKFSPKFA